MQVEVGMLLKLLLYLIPKLLSLSLCRKNVGIRDNCQFLFTSVVINVVFLNDFLVNKHITGKYQIHYRYI